MVPHRGSTRVLPSASRLAPLFSPRSVAVLGASARPGRPGHQVLEALLDADPALPVYPITPRYEDILGLRCHPDFTTLPEIDLAIIASAPDRIEQDVERAITAGAQSLLAFGAPYVGRESWLADLAQRVNEAGIPMLGPDTLGFAHLAAGVAATWAKPSVATGGIVLISQSGTVYWEANTTDPRLGFALTAHTGLEGTVTVADVISYGLELEQTSVIGVYVETIRDAEQFAAALECAAEHDIPVVALYAGRTERARAQMTTHAGRIAGDRASLEGLFRRHGATMTTTPDEWWTTITLLAHPRRPAGGGLAAVMDSGGGLAMFLDYADELQVPMAELADDTRRTISQLLAVDEPQGSAIDFWVGDVDRHATTEELLVALAADDHTAAVLAFTTYGEPPSAGFAQRIASACLAAAARTPKPIVAATYTSRQLHPGLMLELSRAGIPTLDGMHNALAAFSHAFRYTRHRHLRDQLRIEDRRAPAFAADQLEQWQARLRTQGQLMEAQALEFLSAFGIDTVSIRQADDEHAAVRAAHELGFPVVLKTDEGIGHKAARGGVVLGLRDGEDVAAAYRRLAQSLGPRVLLAPMLTGVEIAFGVVIGEFGPTLMISAGGGLIELLTDRCYVLGPAEPEEIAMAMSGLQITRALRADPRSRPHLDEIYKLASRVSHVGAAFAGQVLELDVNPVIVGEAGCVAVDALVGTSREGGRNNRS